MNLCICGKAPHAIKSRVRLIEGVWVRGIWAIDRDGKRCCGRHLSCASTRKENLKTPLDAWQLATMDALR